MSGARDCWRSWVGRSYPPGYAGSLAGVDEHYFTASPTVETEERTHRFTIHGVGHTMVTTSGISSADRPDKGTQILFDRVPDLPETGVLLDPGRGQGPITFALAGVTPRATVLATDVNGRFLVLTARNTVAAGLDNVCTSQAEMLLAELCQTSTPTDLVRFNLPVRIGKDALHGLLLSWLTLLSADDEAWLVILRSLGAGSLAIWLNNQGWDVNRMASLKGFRVLRARRRHS